jgi:formylglycine-generating enzyme required for sulfatase activity
MAAGRGHSIRAFWAFDPKERKMIHPRLIPLAPPAVVVFLLGSLTVVQAQEPQSFEGTKPAEVRSENSLHTKLLWIPAGEFTMGSPKNEKDHGYDEEQVKVRLTKGFWLGEHEVTQAEWDRIMQTTPWRGREIVKEGDDYPATRVSWDDAMKFCESLTRQERRAGRLPEDWTYTLPTEAQWEYACRAGTTTRFSFGDDESDLPEYAWFEKNTTDVGEKYAHAVGQKKPNSWGLYDMHGSVWEWCRDSYARDLPGGDDPEKSSRRKSDRVVRSGRWGGPDWGCRSAARMQKVQDDQEVYIGFRFAVVRTNR